jgi:hypothetical protein
VFLSSAVSLFMPCLCRSGDNPAKTTKINGTVVQIEPVRLTIQTGKNRAITVHTAEDHSAKLAVGTPITAWYYRQGEIYKLDRLEYPSGVSFVPPDEFVPRIRKVILLPSSNAGDAHALFRAIEQFFETRFDWVVSHRMLAEEIRSRFEMANRAPGARVVSKGQTAPVPLSAADPKLIQKIASETRVDAVLETQIERVMVKVDSHTANWDGARESFGTKSAKTLALLTIGPVRGQVPAATAVLRLHDSQGKPLWGHRRGICVLALQVGTGSTFRDRPISEVAENAAFVEAWLNDVFKTWLPTDLKSRKAATQH